tara:strand:- start:2157 stop:2984 length:828 start_codon:yes stop_codon:yes gene_type:complete
MSFYKYLTIIFSILTMNFAFAELRTWGMPTDTPEEESPTEEASPEGGSPEEVTPEESTPVAPEEVAPEEDNPEESTPEQDDMGMTTDDSELSDNQPVKFKEEYMVSASLTLPIYTGSNLEYRFDNGAGFSLGISTPFSFNLMNKDINISASLRMNNFSANDDAKMDGTSDYSPTLIGVNLNTDLSILDMSIGSGLATASGDIETGSEYSMTSFYASVGLGYTLLFENLSFIPDPFKGMNLTLGGDMVMIMSAPDETGDTSNFINFGMSLGYPIFF